jgi:hypothetical protein
MSIAAILGWSVIVTVLVTLSACLVEPPLRYLDRRFPLGTWRSVARLALLGAGSLALWHAIPFVVEYVYLRI